MLSTTIHNDIRVELGLSVDEYVVASAIDFYAYSPYNDEPWAVNKSKEIGELFNFSSRSMVRAIHTLVDIGVVEKSGHRKMRTTKLWREIHSMKKISNGAAAIKHGENPPADSKPRKEYEAKMGADDHANWLTFWELYKTINYRDRENACKVFAKHAKHFIEIMLGLNHYIADLAEKSWQEPKMASAWLNAKRWCDYEGKGEPKKISNGAAAPVDPFESFRAKCLVLSQELYDGGHSGKLAAMEQDELWDMVRFDSKEISVIKAVGFAKVMMHISEGGFVAHEIKPMWESVG